MRDEEEEDEGRGGPGWIATLIGAVLLLGAGFAVGVVVGAVREEPAMLLRYVAGRGAVLPAPPAVPSAPSSSPVPAVTPNPSRGASASSNPPTAAPDSPSPSPSPQPATAAPPLVVAPAAPEALAPRPALIAPAPSPGSAPPVASEASSRARFAVQVGAFAQSGEAEKLEAQLRRKGLPAYVQPATGGRDSRWRVRVGPLPTRDEADRVATKLKTQDKLPVWVLEESG